MDTETFDVLMQLLPAKYAVWVFASMGALSAFTAVLKPLMTKLPAGARPWADAIFYFLDLMAANTKPLHERKPAKQTIIPPPGYDPKLEGTPGALPPMTAEQFTRLVQDIHNGKVVLPKENDRGS